jgi:hypothetical protein
MAHSGWSCGIIGEQDDKLTVPRDGKRSGVEASELSTNVG